MAFKVIQGHRGRYQSKARICDFLLVINSNWHPIWYRFGVIAAYCSNFDTAFWAPFRGLRDNVRCSSRAHWKARSRLSISVNWTFFTRSYDRISVENRRFCSTAVNLTQNFT